MEALRKHCDFCGKLLKSMGSLYMCLPFEPPRKYWNTFLISKCFQNIWYLHTILGKFRNVLQSVGKCCNSFVDVANMGHWITLKHGATACVKQLGSLLKQDTWRAEKGLAKHWAQSPEGKFAYKHATRTNEGHVTN